MGVTDTHNSRISVLENQLGTISRDVSNIKQEQRDNHSKLEDCLKEIGDKVDAIDLAMAEARGAAKFAKWAGHGLAAILAALAGGLTGNLAAAQKISDHLK